MHRSTKDLVCIADVHIFKAGVDHVYWAVTFVNGMELGIFWVTALEDRMVTNSNCAHRKPERVRRRGAFA